MKLDLPENVDDEPDITPLIDVVFLLIVFFMIVANVLTEELKKIDIPVAENSKVPEERKNRQIVTVTQDGSYWIGTELVLEAELEQFLATAYEASPNKTEFKVLIRGDADSQHKDIRKVMKACAAGGIVNIIFSAYQTETGV